MENPTRPKFEKSESPGGMVQVSFAGRGDVSLNKTSCRWVTFATALLFFRPAVTPHEQKLNGGCALCTMVKEQPFLTIAVLVLQIQSFLSDHPQTCPRTVQGEIPTSSDHATKVHGQSTSRPSFKR